MVSSSPAMLDTSVIRPSNEAEISECKNGRPSEPHQQMTRFMPKQIAKSKRGIFPFLELPAEIRNMVYNLAITDHIGPSSRINQDYLWLDYSYTLPPLFHLNRQTQTEALPLLFCSGDKRFCVDFSETCDRDRVVHPSFRSWFRLSNAILKSVLIRVDLDPDLLPTYKEISVKYRDGKFSFECDSTFHDAEHPREDLESLLVDLEHGMRSAKNIGIGLQELKIMREILVSKGCITVPTLT